MPRSWTSMRLPEAGPDDGFWRQVTVGLIRGSLLVAPFVLGMLAAKLLVC